MSIKKYTAASMQKALKQIREELGDDAIIVSNRKLPNGKVEISVQVEEDESSMQRSYGMQEQLPAPTQNRYGSAEQSAPSLQLSNEKAKQLLAAVRSSQQMQENTFAQTTDNANLTYSQQGSYQQDRYQRNMQAPAQMPAQQMQTPDMSSMMHSTLMQLQQELHELRSQVQKQKTEEVIEKPVAEIPEKIIRENQIKQQQQLESKKSIATVKKHWRSLGLGDELFNRFSQSQGFASVKNNSPEMLWKASLRYVKGMIPRYRRNPVESPGIYAFVGPTGAGKTTTLGKLAVRQVARWGADKVGIVTMDSFRIGAWEQMKRLGDIIGVKTALCRQEDSLMDTLSCMRECKFILIDTAGLSHQDERRVAQWNKLKELGDELETYLVAPANLQESVLDQLTKAYEPAQIRALIFSKCDEITRLGEAVTTVIKSELPWVFACDGQKIPEDLKTMSVDMVLQTLLATSKRKRWEYAPTASEQENILVSAMG